MRTAAADSSAADGPLFDSEAMTFVDQTYQSAYAFLFGRRTHDLFAGTGAGWIRAAAPSQMP